MSKYGYRTYMYTQQLSHLPAHLSQSRQKLSAYLNDNLPRGTQWAYIVHNKDVYTTEDQKKDSQRVAGTPKEEHVHIAFYLPNTKTISAMAKVLGDKEQYITKFTGGNAKQNLFSYLMHRTEGSKADGKHEYSFAEVESNFEYEAYVNGVASAIQAVKHEKETIQELIFQGELRFIDFVMEPEYRSFYLNNKTFVTNCIDTRYKQLMNLRDDQRPPIEVIYIQGGAGSGKTHYAKEYAKRYFKDYCISSSQNDVTQDYLGQDVMIFDDARPSDFSASEWLKVLDPYNNQSTVSSRYYNKYLAVKCIIITTTTQFEEFFVYAKGKGEVDEPVGQFMRRFSNVIKCERYVDQGLLYTKGNVYEPVGMRDSVQRYVGNSRVEYMYELRDTGVKFQTFIADMNANRNIVPLSRFEMT